MEYLIVAALALSFGLFIGNLFSESLSDTLLRSELIAYEPAEDSMGWSDRPSELWWHDTGVVILDEVIETFDFSLSATEVTVFYGLGLLAIILGVGIPLSLIVRLKPKNILM